MISDLVVVIHGGAGVIDKSVNPAPYFEALKSILNHVEVFAISNSAITAIDIVEYTVKLLEDEPLFNAGRGAVLTSAGTHELEASIMDGDSLQCGAVSLVTTVKNPISLARVVMTHTPHNYLIGEDVTASLAQQHALECVPNSYFTTERRLHQLNVAKAQASICLDHSIPFSSALEVKGQNSVAVDHQNVEPGGTGTVGCVCMLNGKVAAATSTGGLTNKMPGRVGDTPILGAGTYAHNETGAFSGTGTGEEFMRHVATHDAHCRMKYGGRSIAEAVNDVVTKVLPNDCGGIIAVDAKGGYSMPFNTLGMFRGIYVNQSLSACVRKEVGIWEEMISF